MTFPRFVRHLLPLLLVLVASLVFPRGTDAVPPSIRVVMDDNYPPFVFRDATGGLRGVLIDQWRLWERKSGIRAEISAMDWDQAQRRMLAGEFDVIDTLFKAEERLALYDFSRPYQAIDVPIFFDNHISGITDVASLRGFVVAAKRGDAAVEILKRNGVTNLLLYNSYEAIIRAAREQRVTIFVVDRPPALYYLHKYGIFDRFRQSSSVNTGAFHRAVRKGDRELLRVVEDGFARISASELKEIETRWYGSTLPESRLLRQAGVVAGCLALLLLALFVWNRALSAKVATRTAELKKSMDALQAQATFVASLMEAIPIPVFYKDGDLRYLGCNGAFEEFYGTTREELLGKGVHDVAPRELAEEYHDRDRELLRNPGSQIYESQVKNARGEVRDVVFHKATFADAGGRISGVVGAILDITERKRMTRSLAESELRLRTLVQTIPDLIWLKDSDGVYLTCNPMFERFFGAPEAEIVGRTDYDFVDREMADLFREHDRKAMALGGPSSNEEWITFADDGRRALLSTVKTPMYDGEGNLVGVLGIARDITELRTAEGERLRLERQLLNSQKLESLGLLAGGIAHDFNNLLQAILGHLDLALLKLPQDSGVRKNVSLAMAAATHAAHLTGMMLAYTGKGVMTMREINLSELVGENADTWRKTLSGAVRLDLRLDPLLPAVMGDAGQLLQVITNLVANASEAMGDGTGVITMATGAREFDQSVLEQSRLEEKLPAGYHVWLEVRDNGVGMDEQTQQRLFDPFFTTKFIGRGLGMSMVLGIIRAHRGALLVTSSPGAGTTMQVILPVASEGSPS
jgi:PAS domain S-box-containing protein